MEHNDERAGTPDIRSAEGFAEMVKRIERLLFSASFAILRNRDACADVVQSALMKAWKNRNRLNDRARFKSWMVKIVTNESKNYLRGRACLPLDENIAGREQDQAKLDVERAVLRLPEAMRLIVMLYYFERYPVKDICAILNLPEGTVHSRLSRAREQLRKELPDYASKR